MSLELYHYWDSVCSFKVRLCLAEKSLAWTSCHVDLLRFEQVQPAYLKINPNGQVPSLVHQGISIIESSVINEYLDQVFPDAPLRPADPVALARMRIWVKYEDDVIHPAVRPGTFNLMLKSAVARMQPRELEEFLSRYPKPEIAKDWAKAATSPVDHEELARSKQKLDVVLGRMESALSEHEWLACDQMTLADLAIAPMIDRLEHLAMAGLWSDRPHVTAWMKRITARPSYAAAAPQADQRMSGPLTPAYTATAA